MKNILLFILLILCGINIPGQTFNYAHHSGSETTFNMVGINSKSFYIEKSIAIGSCCNDKMFVVGVNGSGVELFRKQVGEGAYLDDAQVAATADGYLLALAGTTGAGCDYAFDSYDVYKLDTTGNVVWNFHSTIRIEKLIPWPDGGFYIQINGQLLYYSPSGQQSNYYSLFVPSGCHITLDQNHNFVMSYITSGSARLRVIDSTGFQLLDTTAVSALTGMIQAPSGNIYGLSGGQIHQYSSSYAYVSNSGNSIPLASTITAFTLRNYTLYITGRTTLSKPFYMALDSDFNIIHQSASNLTNVFPTGIHVNKQNYVSIISYGKTGIAKSNPFSAFFKIPFNGNLNGKHDIGVTGFSIIDDPFYVQCNGPCYHARVNLMVTIKNFGIDTVKKFHLNNYGTSSAAGAGYCYTGLSKLVSQSLPPGGTLAIQTGTFNTGANYNYPLPKGSTFSYNVCVNTSVPGAENDIDISNDFHCQVIQFVPVGLEDVSFDETKIQIYPNPSSGNVTVNSDIPINTIEIYNLTGKMIKNIEVDKNEFYLENKSLPNGLYIFKINTDKGIVTKKVAIE